MKNKPKIMLFLLLAITYFFLFTSLLGFYSAIKPTKFISKITPKDLGLNYEEVSFKTQDNLILKGWFIPQQNKFTPAPLPQNSKTIILLHGYPADKGDILPSLAFLSKNFNLFLFDFRYFGQSQGKYTTIGIKETKDLLAAVSYLKSRGISQVGVYGFSMGGAAALMTAPQTSAIKAVVSEASYSRLNKMAHQLYTLPFLKYPLGWLTGQWGKIFLGVNIYQSAPVTKISSLKIPVLIIHSPSDTVIPFSQARELKEALKNNSQAEFWFPENFIHGQHNPEFQKTLQDFFTRNL